MAKVSVNCSGTPSCECSGLNTNSVRYETIDGRKCIVAPVVMAISDVVMNGMLYPSDEYFAPSWNGVPLTVGHPQTANGDWLSANAPGVIEKWCVGRLFGTEVKDEALVGEVWVDVAKANKIRPGLVQRIASMNPLDVSTGFWSDPELSSGNLNGVEYEGVHRNVRPDHLALLPDEDGACSWQDGCGVRTNSQQRGPMLKLNILGKKNANKVPATNAEDTRSRLIGSLLADERTPFGTKDMAGLNGMSDETLDKLYQQYIPPNADDPEEPAEKPAEEPDGDEGPEDDKEKDGAMNAKQIEDIVNAAVTKALAANAAKAPAISAEDRAAINAAKAIVAAERTKVIEAIVANSKMQAAFLEKLDTVTLNSIREGLAPAPVVNYGARAMPSSNLTDDDEAAEGMSTNSIGVVDLFRKKKS